MCGCRWRVFSRAISGLSDLRGGLANEGYWGKEAFDGRMTQLFNTQSEAGSQDCGVRGRVGRSSKVWVLMMVVRGYAKFRGTFFTGSSRLQSVCRVNLLALTERGKSKPYALAGMFGLHEHFPLEDWQMINLQWPEYFRLQPILSSNTLFICVAMHWAI